MLAARYPEYGQRVETVLQSDATAIASEIDAIVNAASADATTTALTIVLPTVKDLTILVNVALCLEQKTGWQATKVTLTGTPGGSAVAFRVTRDIPHFGGVTVPSEVLVLGDFPEFPATRRAPVVALEIFVGKPPQLNRAGKPTVKANLDLVDIQVPTQAAFEHMWKQTEKERLTSLGGIDDPRARAKVSFVVPLALAKTLGCAP
jgi:hypothetical protein